MVIFIREQGAKAAREKTTFAKPAAERRRAEREARLQARDRRRGRRVPVVDRVPARRPHARHRKGRPAAHRREGPARCPRRSAACRRCGRRARAACSTSPCIPTTRRTAGSTCPTAIPAPTTGDDRDRPRQAARRPVRRVSRRSSRRPPSCIATAERALRLALRLRRQGPPLLQHRRARPGRRRAGPRRGPNGKVHRINEDGTHPEGQPVRRQAAARCRRSGATATATRRASRSIRRPASSGRSSTARAAATS